MGSIKNRYRGIDLHTHSTASDGTLTPSEIINLAAQSDLAAVAITDHDTLGGVRQINPETLPENLHFITGIEMSVSWPLPNTTLGSMHLLGYGFELDHLGLNMTLDQLKRSRENRTTAMLDRLNDLGFLMCLKDVHQLGGSGQAGRPHIAQCMVKKGYALDFDDAFDRYLGHGKPAYVDRYRISAKEGIELIRRAGGIPVMAHPMLYGWKDFQEVRLLVGQLVQMGLMGIEVYYPGHSVQETHQLVGLAEEMELLMTGGSDFHGALKPAIKLGRGTGNLCVPFSLFERLSIAISGTLSQE